MPIQYRACFTCDDDACTGHDFSILDWGLYVLNRRQYADRGPAVAERMVIAEITKLLDSSKREPYFFLGNSKAHSHTFSIVGLFHPPLQSKPKESATPRLPGF